MTLREALEDGRRALESAGVPDAETDARILLERTTGVTRSRYFLDPEREVPAEQADRYRELIGRRARRIPLQHLTGETEFMGLPFRVDESVLIPRPDTEILAELALDWAESRRGLIPAPFRALDLCTGSGCVAVSLAKLGPFAAVAGSDISGEALATARENGRRNGCENLEFRQSDLFAAFAGERFSLITANPPYIPSEEIGTLMPEVRDHDPRIALDGGPDGLDFYRRLAAECPEHLDAGGRVFFEIGYDQGEAVTALLRQAGFTAVEVRPDLAGNPRVVTGEWICSTD